MTRTIRGIRDSIPGGTLIGRAKSGSGPAEPVDLSAIAAAIAALQRGKAALNSTGAILKANPVQLDFMPPGGTAGQILTKASGTDFDAHWVSGGSGTGDVVGPSSAVANHVAFFDGTTGKLIKDSGLTLSGSNTGDQTLSDATLSTSDITTNNVSITKHGFAPKAPNDATKYLDGTGAYSVPSGGGGGSAQHKYEAFGALPLASAFTALNLSTDTLANSATALVLTFPGSSGSQPLRPWSFGAPPATPWTIYLRGDSLTTGQTNGVHGGIYIRNSSSGKIETLSIYEASSTTPIGVASFRFTSFTVFSATNFTSGNGIFGNRWASWLSITNDGTNLKFSFSYDGINFVQMYSETLATFMSSVDDFGIYGAPPTSATGYLFVSSFGTAAPA